MRERRCAGCAAQWRRAHRWAALAIFESIGARPWAARSEVEPAATGVRTRTNSADLTGLTAQELQVAQSVAEGRNNSEVAASLFVSRKTVEAHLTRIHRKLGVRSRTELARLLAPTRGDAIQCDR
ncbi:MAG: response regulator transcription factor [Pseudonocardiaceae bacterium]